MSATWTEEREKQLRSLHAASLSFPEIHHQMPEFSKNAIVGKCHRMGLAPKQSVRRRIVRRASAVPQLRALHTAMQAAPEPLPVLDEPGAGSGGGGVSLLDLENHMCRWPIGPLMAKAELWCGTQKRPGSSFCPEHHARVFTGFTRPINLPVELTRDRRAA